MRFKPAQSMLLTGILGTLAVSFGIQIGATAEAVSAVTPPPAPVSVSTLCENYLKKLPGQFPEPQIAPLCKTILHREDCQSTSGEPIFHYEKLSHRKDAKKILVLGLIHGDEEPSGSVARSWIERLTQIDPRNSWRIIPILNPDGWHKNSRINPNGVDLNRNFPTLDWEKEALQHWKSKTRSDPRRYPGPQPGSEKETQCAIHHIDDFKPDFIVSIHTPYGLLDFDGPKNHLPKSKLLPWRFLGHYPGSLGRYMWHDQQIPVFTIELKEKGVIEALQKFDTLQDLAGTMALFTESKSQPTTKAPTHTTHTAKQ